MVFLYKLKKVSCEYDRLNVCELNLWLLILYTPSQILQKVVRRACSIIIRVFCPQILGIFVKDAIIYRCRSQHVSTEQGCLGRDVSYNM